MAIEKFIIELRVTVENDDMRKVLIELGRSNALGWVTSAMLISGKRKPQISFTHGDFFEGEKEISLGEDVAEDLKAEDDTPTGQSPRLALDATREFKTNVAP